MAKVPNGGTSGKTIPQKKENNPHRTSHMNIKHYSTKTNPMKGAFTFIELSLVIVIMTASLLLTGCGNKKSEPSPVTTQPEVQPAQPAPAENTPTAEVISRPPVTAPVVTSPGLTNVNMAVDFTKLNSAIRGWRFEHGRMPTNFDEFAATCGFYIPPPPPGKKYDFDNRLHARLINR
jgi:hypothetical protein